MSQAERLTEDLGPEAETGYLSRYNRDAVFGSTARR